MMPFKNGIFMIQRDLKAVQPADIAGAVFENDIDHCLQRTDKEIHIANPIQLNPHISPHTSAENTKSIAAINKKPEVKSSNSDLKPHQGNIRVDLPLQTISYIKRPSEQSTYQMPYLTPPSISVKRSSYSDLVQNSTDLLRNIITSLQSQNDSYEISDGEDDDAKFADYDLTSKSFNGKNIPSWACNPQLFIAVSKQNQKDGDQIFRDLSRKVDANDFFNLFHTKAIPYYQKQKRV